MKIACGRRIPDHMSLLRHESKQVLIERAQEILRQHPEQVAQHLQDPEVLTAQSVAEEQTRQSVEQLTEELSKQIQLSEKLNRPGCSSVEQLLKQRHTHLVSLREELQGRAAQQTENLKQLAIRLQYRASEAPQQPIPPLHEWLTQRVEELKQKISVMAPSNPIWLSENAKYLQQKEAEHLQKKADDEIRPMTKLPSLEEQIKEINGSVLPEDVRNHVAIRSSILEEWKSTLQLQLPPESLDAKMLPTAFLRNIARLQEDRLSERLKAFVEDRSKIDAEKLRDPPEAYRLLKESLFIDGEDLKQQLKAFIRLLERALEESTLALDLLTVDTPPDRFQSMRELWTNEKRWLEHIICEWENNIAILEM
jgi:hypothetical protein